MRIALVSDTYTPQVNGVTTVVARIAQVLRDFGHDVAVVAPRYPGNGTSSPDELRIPSAAFPPYPAIRLSVPQFGAVARFLDAFRPDVVHVATEGPLGLIEPGLGLLKRLPSLRPLARELTRGGVASQVVASELLPAERAVLWALTKAAGLGRYQSQDCARATSPARRRPPSLRNRRVSRSSI